MRGGRHRRPAAPAPTLLDVAVYVTDAERFTAISEAAAAFLGCETLAAQRLLLGTPPVLVGKVSRATVEALRSRLGEGAVVVTSDPERARFDVLLGECPAPHRARFLAALRAEGHHPADDDGPWLLRGLTRAEADEIWTAHRRVPNLQIINQDFYPTHADPTTG